MRRSVELFLELERELKGKKCVGQDWLNGREAKEKSKEGKRREISMYEEVSSWPGDRPLRNVWLFAGDVLLRSDASLHTFLSLSRSVCLRLSRCNRDHSLAVVLVRCVSFADTRPRVLRALLVRRYNTTRYNVSDFKYQRFTDGRDLRDVFKFMLQFRIYQSTRNPFPLS